MHLVRDQLTVLMKILIFCISVVFYYSSNAQGQAYKDSLMVIANKAYDLQEYVQALANYSELISVDSTSVVAFEKAGLSAYKIGDLPISRQLFIGLEKIDSTNKLALAQLASLYEQEQNTPKAIKYYTKLIKLFPENPIYYRKLAKQYQGAGLKRDASTHYQSAYELNPKDQLTIKGLAELYLYEKEYLNTDSLLWTGLASDSTNIHFNLLIANSKYRQKAYDSTVYYMEVIRGKYDFRPHQNKMLGYAYLQVDSLDKSIRYLTKAINDPGTKEYAHYNLGVAYERKADIEYALHHYNEAVKAGISDDIDLYHRNVARLYAKEEKLKEAISHYKDAYKYGKDPLVQFYLARASDVYYKDKSIAIRYYSSFIKSAYDHPEYIQYSKERKRYLKEQLHQSK